MFELDQMQIVGCAFISLIEQSKKVEICRKGKVKSGINNKEWKCPISQLPTIVNSLTPVLSPQLFIEFIKNLLSCFEEYYIASKSGKNFSVQAQISSFGANLRNEAEVSSPASIRSRTFDLLAILWKSFCVPFNIKLARHLLLFTYFTFFANFI